MLEETNNRKQKCTQTTEPLPGLPKELQEFRHLFKECKLADMLLEYQPWDHEIEIMKGIKIKPQKMQ